MTTRTEIKQKLIIALITEIKKTDKALVDYEIQSNIKITDVEYINPRIISPEDIDKDDFEKATVIDFERTRIRLNKAGESNIHYCDGKANLEYTDDNFFVDLKITSIKSNL